MAVDLAPVPPRVDPAAIAAGVAHAWEAWLLKDQYTPQPHPYVWASSWRTCERRMVYELTCPDQRPPWDAFMLAKFRRGNDRERDLLADMSRIGRDAAPSFEVIGQQERFELKDRRGQVAIAGKVDARLKVGGRAMPLEVKSWAPTLVDRIQVFDDLFNNPWTQGGGYQLLSYLYGSNEPCGFLLLDRSGLPLLLPVELDPNLDRVEEFLARAERVNAHAAAGTVPDFLDDPAECRRCSFYGTACHPPLGAADVQVLTDPTIESDLERWHELRAAGKEWSALDAKIKDRLRGIENGYAGHFAISGRWSKSTRVELPPELKRQYSVSDPKGRFTLSIERL